MPLSFRTLWHWIDSVGEPQASSAIALLEDCVASVYYLTTELFIVLVWRLFSEYPSGRLA